MHLNVPLGPLGPHGPHRPHAPHGPHAPHAIVGPSFRFELYALVAMTVILSILVSGTFFYLFTYKGPVESYARLLFNLSLFKSEVVKNSIYIYLSFSVFALFAVIGFGIYYSHKVAGPLIRLKIFAGQMEAGEFGADLKFRSGDVIHDLADAGNRFSKKYGERYTGLNKVADRMRDDALDLSVSIERGDRRRAEEALRRISEGRKEMNGILSEVRL